MVIDLLKIHPMTSMLSGSGEALSNLVHMTDEMSVACHAYFTQCGELDIERYYQAIETRKKALKSAS